MTRWTRHLTLTMTTTLAALVVAGAALAQYPSDGGGVVQANDSVAGQSGEGWSQALQARSEGLNRHYGLGTQDTSSPNDKAGTIGIGAVATSAQAPDAFERAAIRAAGDTPMRPDDRAAMRGPGIVPTGSVLLAATADDGFQWGDASLGAGFVLGLVLVAGLVGLTIRHRGGPVSA